MANRPSRLRQQALLAQVKMATFDALPREVRAVIAEAPFDVLDCAPLVALCERLRLLGFTAGQMAHFLQSEMLKTQNAVLAADNHNHRRLYGVDLPHIAAGATLLRVGAAR
jgi:hypothetical protein